MSRTWKDMRRLKEKGDYRCRVGSKNVEVRIFERDDDFVAVEYLRNPFGDAFTEDDNFGEIHHDAREHVTQSGDEILEDTCGGLL